MKGERRTTYSSPTGENCADRDRGRSPNRKIKEGILGSPKPNTK